MIVRRFKKSDRETLKKWLFHRHLPDELADQTPSFGMIVEGIAAGFIRKMESCRVGYVDGFITNPEMSSEDRNRALDLLMKTLFEKAKQKGFEKVFGESVEMNILTRSLRHGFEVLPHVMVGKKL